MSKDFNNLFRDPPIKRTRPGGMISLCLCNNEGHASVIADVKTGNIALVLDEASIEHCGVTCTAMHVLVKGSVGWVWFDDVTWKEV